MLDDFAIKSTKVEEPKPLNIRKDGLTTVFSRFYISISALNTIEFSRVFDYPFNRDKKIALSIAVKEAEIKLLRMKKQVAKYEEALKLYGAGMSMYKIAKKLHIQYSTAKYWLKTKEHLPVLISQDSGVQDEI